MQVYDTPEAIRGYRQRVLLKGLEAELRGMSLSRGRSCYSIIKDEYSLKGGKQKVYDQFKKLLQGEQS